MQSMTENFIGRKKELAQLIQWLENADDSLLFYLHDESEDPAKKGGIGKTWLLRKFAMHISGQLKLQSKIIPVFIDFFNVIDRDGITIAERVIQALRIEYPNWIPQAFEKNLRQYHKALQMKNTNVASIVEHLSDALSSDLRVLHERMVETNTSILLLFDTFEFVENNPMTAVLHTSHTFPETYDFERIRVVMAGRNALNMRHPNWIGREKDVTSLSLAPFNYEETEEYLKQYVGYLLENQPADVLRRLRDRTEGRPILLGLVADVLENQEVDLKGLLDIKQDQFEESLVTQINNFSNPIKWAIFFMAHIYHRFDQEFLQLIMSTPGLDEYIPTTQYQEVLKRLPALSFVRHSSSSLDFVLHDEMRRMVNKYCWERQDPVASLRRELSKLAINYYDRKLLYEEHEGTRQSYIVEILFHHLVINKDEGFQFFEEHFERAIRFAARAFARSLFQEVQKFGELFVNERLSQEQQHVLQMDEATLLHEEENFGAELKIYEELELDTLWAERHRSDLLYEKGPCYLRLRDYSQAIACFNACLEIEQANNNQVRCATLLSRLGYVYRLQGRYAEAMRYYEEALIVQRNLEDLPVYADLLNNIANVQRMQGGKLEKALISCKLALRIRRDLFKQGKISENDVALSLSTLGYIYHTLGVLDEEEKAYKEAFEIYSRLGDRSSIASTHNNFGRILVKKGDLNNALAAFEQAARIAANENPGSEIESLNQRGRIFLQQEKWEEALDFFTKAEALARKYHLRFERAENLLYLAVALDYLGKSPVEQIKEAKRIARANDYSYLLAQAGEIQGDMFLRRHEYQSAFKHYRVSCRYMALRGSPEFDRTLRKLNDSLLEVPPGFLPGIIDSLLSYWYELSLNETYPELLHVCREVSRNMLL